MQRCPYIHEMRERLLGPTQETVPLRTIVKERVIEEPQLQHQYHHPRQMAPPNNESNQVGTMIKLNPDGYGSHTSPTHQRTPLVPRDLGEDFSLDNDFSEPLDPRLPKNAKTSLFIITSLVYAMLLIVVCIAYVISDVSTHRLPIMYYEGFFTYLYGASILFLLYVFCFLLQESTCCNGGGPKAPKPVKEKKPKKQKPKKTDAAATDGKDSGKGGKEVAAIPPVKPTPFQDATAEADQSTPKNIRKRKTTQNDPSYGSFFLRIGAIAFGLGTMIYVGLEFGSFFEIPFTSPCHQILRGVNPLLQMIFTFMQMYFIFMNSRLNIHRFKVLARFGLMHIAATNICVWIRTLVLESLKEITAYHQRRGPMPEDSAILESIRQHTLRNAGTVMGTELGPNNDWEPINMNMKDGSQNVLSRLVKSTVNAATEAVTAAANEIDHMGRTSSSSTSTSTSTSTTTTTTEFPTTTTTEATTISILEKIRNIALLPSTVSTTLMEDEDDSGEDLHTTPSKVHKAVNGIYNMLDEATTAATTTTTDSFYSNFFGGFNSGYNSLNQAVNNATNSASDSYENFDSLFPAGLTLASTITPNATSCGRVNIMGTIVQDSAPYLYPFIIEYSLIGAVVIYVMWKHIGRYPKYTTEEDLEHRLEVMLSRRAVAMAQANNARVDCVGASKGLFFGLLLLVGSLICLILFFVLVRHPQLSLLAIYLADVSHCALMALSLIAIIIGFIRVQTLKFRCEEQGNLNDILLRISAFGLFTYSVFSVIAGSLNAFTSEPNLLVMITGILAVLQVVLQLLFIADVSRRRVHLPEHDRSKPGRQIVTFLLICNVSMFAIYTFEAQKVFANPVQLDFYGYIAWSIIQRVTLPLCIFHRFHSAVTLAEVWKTTYKPRLE